MVFVNNRPSREKDSRGWSALLNAYLGHLMEKDKFTQVEETQYAVGVLFKTAYDVTITSGASQKITKVALQKRAIRSADNGQVVDETIPTSKVWDYINEKLQHKHQGEVAKVPFKTLMDWAVFGQRILSGGRPQDPSLMYLDVLHLVPEDATFENATAVQYRVYNSKDTQLANANARNRPRMEKALSRLSSIVTIQRPKDVPGRINWFTIMHEYYQRRLKINKPEKSCIEKFGVGSVGKSEHEPFYLYPVANKPSKKYTRGSMSTRTLNLMKAAGAITEGSPLKSEHLRHTALSFVHQFAPKEFEKTCANARHSVQTAKNRYVVRIDKCSRQRISTMIQEKGQPQVTDLLAV